jgi:hypothetical protein
MVFIDVAVATTMIAKRREWYPTTMFRVDIPACQVELLII